MAEGGIAPELKPKPRHRVEKAATQEVVIRTFRDGLSEMKAASARLSPEQQLTLQAIERATAETIDVGRDSFTNTFSDVDHPDRSPFTQNEGIPVDGLLEFLNDEACDLPVGDPRELKLRKMIGVIRGNSLSYEQIRGRETKGRADQFLNRVRQEAYWISQNEDRGSQQENFLEAERRIRKRRELILKKPRATKGGTTPALSDTPPSAAAPTDAVDSAPAEAKADAEASPEPASEEPKPESAEEPAEEGSLIDEEREFLYEAYVVNGVEKPRKRAFIESEKTIQEKFRAGNLRHPKAFIRSVALRLSEEWNRQRLNKRGVELLLRSGNSLAKLDLAKGAVDSASETIAKERAELRSKIEGLRKSEKTTVAGKDGVETIEHGAESGAKIIEAKGEIKKAFVSEIIDKIVSGDIKEPDMQEAIRKFVLTHKDDSVIKEIFGTDATKYKVLADYFATDIWDLGQKIKTDKSILDRVGKSIDDVVTLKFANVSWSQEGEVRFNRTDKLVAWAQGGKYRGLIFNPASLGAISSIIATPGTIAAGVGAKMWIAPVVGTALGSAFAGMRRNRDLNVGRGMTEVELAAGMQIGADAKRRKEMTEQGKVGKNMVSLRSLLDGGRELPEGNPALASDTRGLKELRRLDLTDSANQDALMRRIAEIETRFDFGRSNHTDLLSYSEEGQIEQERLGAIIEIGSAKADLKRLGLEDLPAEEVERKIASFRGEFQKDFTKSKEDQDWEFNKYKFRQISKSVAIGAVTGGITAAGFQQGVAWIGRGLGINIGPTAFEQVGPAIGNLVKGLTPHVSAAEATAAGLRHVTENAPLPGAQATETVKAALGNKDIPLPGGGRIAFNKSGTSFSIVDATGHSPNHELAHIPIVDGKVSGVGKLPLPEDVRQELIENHILVEKPGAPTHVTEHVTGKDGLWEKLKTPIKTREHYANNTRIPDKEELQLYTSKLRNGSVVLNMRHMQPTYENGLVPSKINPADVIKNHQSAFVFSLGGDSRHVITIPDGADGKWDGLLHLNPNDHTHFVELNGHKITLGEFTKMVVNQEKLKALPNGNIATEYYGRYDVWNLAGADGKRGLIEAVRLVPGSGGKHIQEFATIHGGMKPPETITITKPGQPTWEIRLPKPPVPPVTPVPPVFTPENPVDAPPVAFPFTPRFPLEQLFNFNVYGGEYGSDMGLLDRALYPSRFSERLKENRESVLDESLEVKEYLEKQSPEYREELEKMDASIGKLMDSERRIVVTVPAYAEGKNIRKMLDFYVNQKDSDGNTIDPKLFEIIIVDNHPGSVPKDETQSELEKFRTDHPEINAFYVEKVWSEEEGGVGAARKYAADLALLRDSKRPAKSGDMIIISADADLDGLTDKYISRTIETFDSNHYIDAAVGKSNLPEEALAKPNIRAAQRFWTTLDRLIARDAEGAPSARQFRSPGMIGRNSMFRASIYAAIGGYNPKAKLAEDLEIGWLINEARGHNPDRILYKNSTEVITNPRRFLAAAAQGIPLLKMYGGFHENTEIRRLDNKALLAKIPDKFDVRRFEEDVDALWQASKSSQYGWLGPRFEPLFKRAMGLMGADYEIVEGHVKVTNVDRLTSGLGKVVKKPPTSPSSKGSGVIGRASTSTKNATASAAGGIRKMASESLRDAKKTTEEIRSSLRTPDQPLPAGWSSLDVGVGARIKDNQGREYEVTRVWKDPNKDGNPIYELTNNSGQNYPSGVMSISAISQGLSDGTLEVSQPAPTTPKGPGPAARASGAIKNAVGSASQNVNQTVERVKDSLSTPDQPLPAGWISQELKVGAKIKDYWDTEYDITGTSTDPNTGETMLEVNNDLGMHGWYPISELVENISSGDWKISQLPPTEDQKRMAEADAILDQYGKQAREVAKNASDRISGMASRLRPDQARIAEVRSQIAKQAKNAWVQNPDVPFYERPVSAQPPSQPIPSIRDNGGANPRGAGLASVEETAAAPDADSPETTPPLTEGPTPQAQEPVEETVPKTEVPTQTQANVETKTARTKGIAKNLAIGFAQGTGAALAAKVAIASAKTAGKMATNAAKRQMVREATRQAVGQIQKSIKR